MADSTIPAATPPLVTPDVAVTDLPEALQSPTKAVGIGFTGALALANATLYLCWIGIGNLLLPVQISQLDPAHKVADLGLITGITALLALITNPVAGALSDRTTSRFGRRRPWLFVGGLVSALALGLMLSGQSVLAIGLGWGFFQVSSNFILAALSAIVPDQVPDGQRGGVSAIVGLALTVGNIVGAILIGQVLKTAALSYAVVIALVLVVFIGYTLILREKVLPKGAVPSFHLRSFLKNFWVNPLDHPDFGWAWLTRFLTILGYFLAFGYFTYYLQDVIHYTRLFPGQSVVQGTSTVTIIMTLVSLVSTLAGGFLSDRFHRRKIFVFIASAVMAVGLLSIAIIPTWTSLLAGAATLGLGFGMYTAVDLALITQVLPSANNRAKDLGIINIANTLPQSLGPVIAAFIIGSTHSYALLFIVGGVVALLSGILVSPIKSVR